MTKSRQKCKGLGPEHPLTVRIEMQKTQGTNKTAMFKNQKEAHDWLSDFGISFNLSLLGFSIYKMAKYTNIYPMDYFI